MFKDSASVMATSRFAAITRRFRILSFDGLLQLFQISLKGTDFILRLSFSFFKELTVTLGMANSKMESIGQELGGAIEDASTQLCDRLLISSVFGVKQGKHSTTVYNFTSPILLFSSKLTIILIQNALLVLFFSGSPPKTPAT